MKYTSMDEINNSTIGNISYEGKTFNLINIGYIMVEMAMILFIGFGNILVLISVCKYHQLRTVTNLLVINVSLGDLLVAVLVLPIHILIFIMPALESNRTLCLLRYATILVSAGTSAVSLLFIAVDRYIAVSKPFLYSDMMSKRRVVSIIVGIWIYAISFASIPFFGVNTWTPTVGCTFTYVFDHVYIIAITMHMVLLLVLITVVYVRVFSIAKRQATAIYNQELAVHTILSVNQNLQHSSSKPTHNNKATKTLALVVGVFAVCMLPFVMETSLEIALLRLHNATPGWINVLRIVTTFLALSNSGINPILYHQKHKEFRKAFKKILRCSDYSISPITMIGEETKITKGRE